MIDWDSVIYKLPAHPSRDITLDPAIWNLTTPGYGEILKLWIDSNVNTASIRWSNYYIDIPNEFAESVNCRPVKSWVSRIDPGYMTGWHWDVDDYENEYKQQGNIVRYTCFIDKPRLGQTFIIDDQCYHNMPQGTTIKWNRYNDWHCGCNGGLEPNYMFHLVGIDRSNL